LRPLHVGDDFLGHESASRPLSGFC
jgi:hypothetical protein